MIFLSGGDKRMRDAGLRGDTRLIVGATGVQAKGSTRCCLPLAPSVQCCLDREHLRGHPPGALIGVWLRGAAANIDSGGSGGAGTHTHRPTPAPSLWAQPRGRPARQLTVKPRSTHGQLTVNSTVNSRSTQRSTQLSPGRLRTGFTLRIRQPVVIRTDKKLFGIK